MGKRHDRETSNYDLLQYIMSLIREIYRKKAFARKWQRDFLTKILCYSMDLHILMHGDAMLFVTM